MADVTIDSPAAPPISRHGKVGVFGAAALVAGSMIGSGVYLLPATMGAIGSISILGWIAATLAALAIAGVFVWLGPAAPQANGLSDYVGAGLGRFFGVQTGVCYWASCWIGLVAVGLAVAGAVGYLLPTLAGPGPRLAVLLAVIWLAVGASWLGPRVIARIEGMTLGIGLLPAILAATAGWFAFHPTIFMQSWNPQGLGLGSAIQTSALSAFWGFLGLECAAATAGVVRDPARNVPRATLLGLVGAAALYIAACSALMGILSADQLGKSTAPFADGAAASLGVGVAGLIAVCAMLRAFGCFAGWTLVGAETTRTAADHGMFPAFFRTRPGEMASPSNLLTMGVLMTLVALGTASPSLGQQFSTLANLTVILSLYIYILAAVSLIRLSARFTPGRRVAAIGTSAVAIACAGMLISSAKPIEQAICLTVPAVAGLLYLWLRRR